MITGRTSISLRDHTNGERSRGPRAAIGFGTGTKIVTRAGLLSVEQLAAGVQVLTIDHGYQPILWIGSLTFGPEARARHRDWQPIRIESGALGYGRPERTLLLSPRHRILLRAPQVGSSFGDQEILIEIRHLLGWPGITVAINLTLITYWYFLLDRHQIVFSESMPTESLHICPETLEDVSDVQRLKILSAIPNDISGSDPSFLEEHFPPARRIISATEVELPAFPNWVGRAPSTNPPAQPQFTHNGGMP